MSFYVVGMFMVIHTILFASLSHRQPTTQKQNLSYHLWIHKDTLYLFSIFLFLGVLVVLRSEDVGNDTKAYRELYRNVAYSSSLEEFLIRYEVGYISFNKLVSLISRNSQAIIIATGTVTTLSYYFFIKKYSRSVYLSVFMFVLLRYLDQNMNIIRESLAISVLLFAYDFIEKKRFMPFLLLVILASTFHKTAFCFLAVWFIVKIPFKLRNVLLLLGGSFCVGLNFSLLFEHAISFFPIYSYYVDGKYFGDTRIASILNAGVTLCFVILVMSVRKRIGSQLYKNMGYEKMLMVLLVGLSILILSFHFNLLDRIAIYFNVFTIILIPNTIALIRSWRIRLLLQFSIILFLFIYYISIITLRPEWNIIYPYTTFFQ